MTKFKGHSVISSSNCSLFAKKSLMTHFFNTQTPLPIDKSPLPQNPLPLLQAKRPSKASFLHYFEIFNNTDTLIIRSRSYREKNNCIFENALRWHFNSTS